jgi:hypothetical protein
MEVITTRWPFFTATRWHAIEETESGFPSSDILRHLFRSSTTASKEDRMPIQNK